MIGLVSALPEELAPLTRDWSPADSPKDLQVRMGTVDGVPVAVLVTGVGLQRAEDATRAFLDAFRLSCLIATGYAGGLCEGLPRGALFAADAVKMSGNGRLELVPSPELLAPLTEVGARPGPLVTSPTLLGCREEKTAMSHLGVGVDMETWAVGILARERQIPWGAVRVVIDEWNEDLPLHFTRYEDGNGSISHRRVTMAVLARPWLIPRLLALGAASRLAGRRLAAFWRAAIPRLSRAISRR